MKRLRLLLAGVAFCAVLVSVVPAAPRVEADPNQMYPIQAGSGVWLVCAASYSGPEAKDLARQLVHWVRGTQKAPAYTFNRADEERKRLNEEYAASGLHKSVRVEEQYAVLIGGYADAVTASKARDVIRGWPLPEVRFSSGESALDITIEGAGKGRRVNPFQTALVIRNPLAPKASTAPKVDPFLKTLNAYEEYSLLKNPKPWTLAVKQYLGGKMEVVSDQKKAKTPTLMEQIFGTSQGETLDAAGHQAHELARVLRKLGFQSWVLHTRTTSIVTVGSFDAIDDKEMGPVRSRLTQLTQQVIANNPSRSDPLGMMPNAPAMEVPHPDK